MSDAPDTDPATALLAAIIAAARTSEAVEAAFADRPIQVWESAPTEVSGREGAVDHPYVTVPNIQVIGDEPAVVGQDEDEDEVLDDPSEAFVDFHFFSRERADGKGGRPEVTRLVGAFRRALVREIPIPGGYRFRVVLANVRDARHFTDADGLTARSILTVRYLVEPTSED